ncbi:MAG TPA: hypothetical protein VLD37_01385 [Candidatus Bilamarchaeum sp.]|nr:hypothetical protein [Candidatus Bilamarchaeum sp.]
MKLILSAILGIGLLLLGCTSGGAPGKGGNTSSGNILEAGSGNYERCVSQCNEASAGSGPNCKDGCMIQEAEDTKDTSWCDRLANQQARPSCYGTVAKSAGDIKICDRLSGTDKNYCIGTFGGPSTN